VVEPLPDFFHQLSETYRSFEGLILENVAIRTRADSERRADPTRKVCVPVGP
jgi:hypothetical protein